MAKAGGFDFTGALRAVCADMIARVPQLGHIELERVAITFSRARKRVSHGLYATLTPLRFEGGARFERRRGQFHTIQRVRDQAGREMLYVLSFYLPRFLDLEFHEKLVTIVHELWHISPEFNGDLRRHPGRCYAHTHSQQAYDAQMAVYVQHWLQAGPDPCLFAFLREDFATLCRRYGRVYGARLRQPQVIAVPVGRKMH